MSQRSTVSVERRLLALLAPLMGTRSAGNALVAATGADVVLKANSIAIPVIVSAVGSSTLDMARPLRVDAEITITAAGVLVPMTSVLGGVGTPLPAGTVIRWDPPIQGLGLTATMPNGLVGGVDSVLPGALRSVGVAEGIAGGTADRDLWLAKAGRFPAVVITWIGSAEGARKGNKLVQLVDRWVATVVVSRQDSSGMRANEGKNLLDAVTTELADRTAVDGDVFSYPAIHIISRSRIATTPSSFIYDVVFETTGIYERANATVYNDWLKMKLDMPTQSPISPEIPVVEDARYDMDPATPPPFP